MRRRLLSSLLPSAKAITRGPRLRFCLDFALRVGASLERQVLSTLPGFPVNPSSQIAAAAPGWNSLPQPCARPGRMHRAALGSSVLSSQSPRCPWMGSVPTLLCVHQAQGSEGIPFSWRESPSLPQQHRAQSLWSDGHGRKVEPGEEREEKGEMPPWLLCCRHRQWIHGKRIQHIPIGKSLAPRTFPYPSENPPC